MQEQRALERHDAPGGERTFAAGRYAGRRVLGEGGQKIVYLVRDSALDRDCALSLLKVATLNPESVRRFQHEARAMARLQGNPYVVDVYDVGDEDGAPYLVSEYVPGGDLRGEIHAADAGLAHERVIGVARDVACALAAAHAQGIVHRDVTPRNVWLMGDGTCKLGDFGLAAGADGAMTAAGGLVGTPAYMAPEQALGQSCDAKSDLYSLGAVMYEMATGRQPFAGDDPLAVVSQHFSTAPVAPTWHNPTIPAPLEALILALLAKAPDERPGSAVAVIEALDALRALSQSQPMAEALNPLERLAGGVFVGRETELGELRMAVESAIAGQRQLVLLTGEPGIGKTRLSEQLSTYAKLRRAAVRWGRCVEGEGAPAYWPWIQILRAHADASDDTQLREDAGADAGRIAQIVPEMAARLGIETTGASSAEQARFELFEALAGWLRRSAQRAPLVLLLDDLHWADEPSVLLLQHLAGALRDSRVLIVGTYRDAEVGDTHPLAKLLGELPRLGAARQLALRGLSADDVASYIELATGQPPPPRLAATVHRQTEGNALFVSEVLRMLTASGAIDVRDESWTQEIPPGVRGVIGRRLGSLSGTCLGMLSAASVLGREFELRVLEPVMEAGLDAVLDALDEAMAAQLVALAPESSRRQGRYIFSHSLVRDTLYDELASGTRLRMHARAAAVLEELYGADPGSRIGALAYHFREAAAIGDVSKAVQYSIAAGDAARKVYAYEECVRQWDAAIDLLGEEGQLEEQAQLMQRAADVMYVSGVGFERGVEYLERALKVWELAGNRRGRAGVHSRLGRMFTTYLAKSDIKRAIPHLEAAVALVADDPPHIAQAYAYASLASAQDRALLTAAGLQAARTAREIAAELGNDSVLAMAMHLEGMFVIKTGRLLEGGVIQGAARDMAERVPDLPIALYYAWDRGFRESHYYGNPRNALRLHHSVLGDRRIAEAIILRERISIEMAEASFWCGDFHTLRGCELPAEDRGILEGWIAGSWLDDNRRNMDEAAHLQRIGNRLVEALRLESAGMALSYLGRLEETIALFEQAVDIYSETDVGAELRSRGLLAIAHAEAAHAVDAQEHLRRCDEILASGEEWYGQIGRIEMARAATLTAADDAPAASAAFASAIDILQQYELVWDEAESLRLWGRALAGSGDADGAMERFQRAIDIYRRIGAGAPYIERIVREYARVPADGADRTWAP